MVNVRSDSFDSLVHKLEGEGKSAHYAKAIAGKVNAEKHGDYHQKDAQEKGDPWSDQNTRETRREAALNHLEAAASTNRDDDLDPDRIKRDLDHDRHEDADRAVEKSIERHSRKRSDEDADMAGVSEMRKRLDEIMSQVKDLCDELDSGARDDESKSAEEHAAGEELDRGARDEREGDKARGEADERKAGEELAKARDDRDSDRASDGRFDAESEAERSRAGKVARKHQLETEHRDDDEPESERSEASELGHKHEDEGQSDAKDREEDDDREREKRGDEAPEDIAESITEADSQSPTTRRNRPIMNDSDIRRRIDVLDARLRRATRPATYKERDELASIQRRCDSTAQALGLRPESPLPGEMPNEYRRRCAALLQPFSDATKGVQINRLDDASFKVIEDRIYADAQAASKQAGPASDGKLIAVTEHDAGGRPVTKYFGSPLAWMRPYMDKPVYLKFADSQTRRNAGAKA